MRSLTKTLLIVGVITAVVSGMGLSSAQAGGFRYRLNYGASCYTPRFCTTSYYTPVGRYCAPSYRYYRNVYRSYSCNPCYTPSYGYYGYYGSRCYTPSYGYSYGSFCGYTPYTSYYSPYTSCYTPSYYGTYGCW